MNLTPRTGWNVKALFFALFTAFLIGGVSLPAHAGLDDAAASTHRHEMRAAGVLRDPVWAQAFYVRAQSAPSRASKISDLRWALEFDDDLQSARLDLAKLLFQKGDPEGATHLFAAATRIGSSFPIQQRILLLVLTLGGGMGLLALLVGAIMFVGKSVPAVAHVLIERLTFLPREARAAAAILTMAAPFLLAFALPPTSAVFWILLLGAAGAWPLLAGGERRICVWALGGLLVLPWALALWTRIVEPSFPTSYTHVLWQTQTSAELDAVVGLRRATTRSHAVEPEHLASLALVARRQGDAATAVRLLEEARKISPQSWQLANNLGNARLIVGNVPGALEAYSDAKQLAPDEARIWANEGQAHLRQLNLARANASFETARKLGYHFVRTAPEMQDDLLLVDATLDASSMWKTFLQSFDSPRVMSWDEAFGMMVRIAFPLRPFFLMIPFVAALAYVLRSKDLPRVHTCASCGKTVCRKCHYRVLRHSLCSNCYNIRQEVRAPILREEALHERRKGVRRWSWALGLVFAGLVPGSGHLLEGRTRQGMAFLFAWATFVLISRTGVAPDLVHGSNIGNFFVILLVVMSIASYLRVASPSQIRGAHLEARSS